MMHRSVIHETSSDTEGISLADNEEEQIQDKLWQDEFNQEPKQKIKAVPYGYVCNDSDDSLYNSVAANWFGFVFCGLAHGSVVTLLSVAPFWLPSCCVVVWHRAATKLMIVLKAKVIIVMKFM